MGEQATVLQVLCAIVGSRCRPQSPRTGKTDSSPKPARTPPYRQRDSRNASFAARSGVELATKLDTRRDVLNTLVQWTRSRRVNAARNSHLLSKWEASVNQREGHAKASLPGALNHLQRREQRVSVLHDVCSSIGDLGRTRVRRYAALLTSAAEALTQGTSGPPEPPPTAFHSQRICTGDGGSSGHTRGDRAHAGRTRQVPLLDSGVATDALLLAVLHRAEYRLRAVCAGMGRREEGDGDGGGVFVFGSGAGAGQLSQGAPEPGAALHAIQTAAAGRRGNVRLSVQTSPRLLAPLNMAVRLETSLAPCFTAKPPRKSPRRALRTPGAGLIDTTQAVLEMWSTVKQRSRRRDQAALLRSQVRDRCVGTGSAAPRTSTSAHEHDSGGFGGDATAAGAPGAARGGQLLADVPLRFRAVVQHRAIRGAYLELDAGRTERLANLAPAPLVQLGSHRADTKHTTWTAAPEPFSDETMREPYPGLVPSEVSLLLRLRQRYPRPEPGSTVADGQDGEGGSGPGNSCAVLEVGAARAATADRGVWGTNGDHRDGEGGGDGPTSTGGGPGTPVDGADSTGGHARAPPLGNHVGEASLEASSGAVALLQACNAHTTGAFTAGVDGSLERVDVRATPQASEAERISTVTQAHASRPSGIPVLLPQFLHTRLVLGVLGSACETVDECKQFHAAAEALRVARAQLRRPDEVTIQFNDVEVAPASVAKVSDRCKPRWWNALLRFHTNGDARLLCGFVRSGLGGLGGTPGLSSHASACDTSEESSTSLGEHEASSDSSGSELEDPTSQSGRGQGMGAQGVDSQIGSPQGDPQSTGHADNPVVGGATEQARAVTLVPSSPHPRMVEATAATLEVPHHGGASTTRASTSARLAVNRELGEVSTGPTVHDSFVNASNAVGRSYDSATSGNANTSGNASPSTCASVTQPEVALLSSSDASDSAAVDCESMSASSCAATDTSEHTSAATSSASTHDDSDSVASSVLSAWGEGGAEGMPTSDREGHAAVLSVRAAGDVHNVTAGSLKLVQREEQVRWVPSHAQVLSLTARLWLDLLRRTHPRWPIWSRRLS